MIGFIFSPQSWRATLFSRDEERVLCFDTFKRGVVDTRERRFVRWKGKFTGDGTIHDEKKKFFEYNP